MKNKKSIIGIIVLILIIFGLGSIYIFKMPIGNILQGYLNFPKPIYESCTITNQNGVKLNIDCNNFDQERQKLTDGNYIADVNYVNKQLGNNGESIVPFTIQNHESTCTFIENGYKPSISIRTGENVIISEKIINSPTTIDLGTTTQLLQINYIKNGKTSAFDQFLCGNGLEGIISNSSGQQLGTVTLNSNGFINTTNVVNQLRIIPQSFHYGNNIKPIIPGNYYLSINIYPDLKFLYQVPCSSSYPKLSLADINTNNPAGTITVPLTGLSPNWAKLCVNKIYLGFQNNNNASDQFQFNGILSSNADNYSETFKLSDFPALQAKLITFPYQGKLSVFFRDRSDSNNVYTLGTTNLNVDPNYQPIHTNPTASSNEPSSVINTQQSSSPFSFFQINSSKVPVRHGITDSTQVTTSNQ